MCPLLKLSLENYMNKHYVCTGGCNGVSEDPGTCQAQDCKDFEKPLTECNCQDGMHEGLVTPCTGCGQLCMLDGKGCSEHQTTP